MFIFCGRTSSHPHIVVISTSRLLVSWSSYCDISFCCLILAFMMCFLGKDKILSRMYCVYIVYCDISSKYYYVFVRSYHQALSMHQYSTSTSTSTMPCSDVAAIPFVCSPSQPCCFSESGHWVQNAHNWTKQYQRWPVKISTIFALILKILNINSKLLNIENIAIPGGLNYEE